jgi:hypothetical protein
MASLFFFSMGAHTIKEREEEVIMFLVLSRTLFSTSVPHPLPIFMRKKNTR